MYRELKIFFSEDCSVNYSFHRSGSPLKSYLIEYPHEKVLLSETEIIKPNNFRKTITPEGFLQLNWDPVSETDQSSEIKKICYEKKGFLSIIQENPLLLQYKETLRIKSGLHLYLHDRHHYISALKKRSKAVFTSATTGYVHSCCSLLYSGRGGCYEEQVKPSDRLYLLPTVLADAQFHCSGTLVIDWILEVIKK
jgi:hypothetical protein